MLVTLEGIDGSGKTTLLQHLANGLVEAGFKVERTQEPTREWVGEAARQGIRERIDALALYHLFVADRVLHVEQMKKWLADDRIVISDRYADSTIAYQAVALEGRLDDPFKEISALQWKMFPKPDLTVFLEAGPKWSLARTRSRRHHESFEEADFLKLVNENYLRLVKEEPERFLRLDASQKPEAVASVALEAVLARAPRKPA